MTSCPAAWGYYYSIMSGGLAWGRGHWAAWDTWHTGSGAHYPGVRLLWWLLTAVTGKRNVLITETTFSGLITRLGTSGDKSWVCRDDMSSLSQTQQLLPDKATDGFCLHPSHYKATYAYSGFKIFLTLGTWGFFLNHVLPPRPSKSFGWGGARG